ncbi:MAG TPA: hypothetical protein VF602_05700 [Pedobacter sp.]
MLLILLNVCYSFLQHYHMPLDGDIAESVVPAGWMHKVFNDPFAFKVLLRAETYPNPNRFFCHMPMFLYLRNVPLVLQAVFNPIDSVYLSCALLKTALQFSFIFLLSFLITRTHTKYSFSQLLLPALIITPLFQNEGYNAYMGVIDRSITYTFFYALPMFLLVLFYLPVYSAEIKGAHYQSGWRYKTGMILLSVILPFSGPLIAGAALTSSALILLKKAILNYNKAPEQPLIKRVLFAISNLPQFLLVILSFLSALSLYSLYIGTYNSTNTVAELAVWERYLRLPKGLYNILTTRLGWPLLLCMSVLNVYIISRKKETPYASIMLTLFKWMCIFCVIYILLLPLGGYRSYRPNIIRYDTILPITVCFIFFYSMSANFIIRNLSIKNKSLYMMLVAGVALIFTGSNFHKLDRNQCERSALAEIAKSPAKMQLLKGGYDCTILAWNKINDDTTMAMNAYLLTHWNIVKTVNNTKVSRPVQ